MWLQPVAWELTKWLKWNRDIQIPGRSSLASRLRYMAAAVTFGSANRRMLNSKMRINLPPTSWRIPTRCKYATVHYYTGACIDLTFSLRPHPFTQNARQMDIRYAPKIPLRALWTHSAKMPCSQLHSNIRQNESVAKVHILAFRPQNKMDMSAISHGEKPSTGTGIT